ncbi:hypothetical protein LCDV1gp022 [Lymphocystis disease virus 1]|uniref:hypothetical protein n=1 Tax=Fish lymphocystis disease virus TaxID=36363 RepID=UPI0000161EF5|nr:hypothetical protein LCDV1gp022 [Lymphocystis disease virus 1]
MVSRSIDAFLSIKQKIKNHNEAGKILKQEEHLLLHEIINLMTSANETLIKVAEDIYIYKEDKLSYKTVSKKKFNTALKQLSEEEHISDAAIKKILNLKLGERVCKARLKILNERPVLP